MFSKSFIVTIVFLGTLGISLCAQNAYGYKSEGVDRVNPTTLMKQADKEGLVVSTYERNVKKELLKIKRTNPKEFDRKLAQGLENSSQYQGYLLEIKEGLQKVENAKKIAKIHLYKKIKDDWELIKTSALNTRVDKTFNGYKTKLKADLSDLYYVKFEDGYVFQVGQWGYVTVSKSLKNVNWRVEFNSKYDKNRLEEGAEDIQIQEDSGSGMDMGSEPEMEEEPAAPQGNPQNE